jgi:D-beta-D-heptose 7-phosphate kinase/D-beta-D-heptose 1-phosphate adenosyltransferase
LLFSAAAGYFKEMSPANLLKTFRKARVLVVGDLILDRYIWGKVSRISPEAPVPVVEVADDSLKLGGAANVAHNIVALGGKATLAGVIGKDRAGEAFRELIGEKGIEGAIFADSRHTTMKTRVIAHNQQIVRFDTEDTSRIGGTVLADVTRFLRRAIHEHDAVIVSDYQKGFVSAGLIKELVRAAKGEKKIVAVDPKVGHFHFYRGVSLITPNLLEAARGSGIEIRDEVSLIRAGKTLMKKLSCGAVLITRGEEGMSLFERDRLTHIPTVARHVYDVTGAGDTVIAAFTLAHAAGAPMPEAAAIANHAAGIVVGEVGTAVVSPEKLLESLRSE